MNWVWEKTSGIVSIPHLNVRGSVCNLSGDIYEIQLSEKSQEYLSTSHIIVKASDAKIKLSNDDIVFVKFNNIKVNGQKLYFKSLEVYKFFEKIVKEEIGHVTWWVPNDFGGLLKNSGLEFEFNGNQYVDSDHDYSVDGRQYFVDIYDGRLLYEEYKNIFPPMKWYNMVNPQETYFDIIVDIYKRK